MPADASKLKNRLRIWAPQVIRETAAETGRIAAQDSQTPRGTEPHTGPKIIEAFEAGPASMSGDTATARLSNTAPQSTFQDRGTRSPILPVRARALRFRVGGMTLFRTSVSGVRARNWWRPVVERSFRQALPNAARKVPF